MRHKLSKLRYKKFLLLLGIGLGLVALSCWAIYQHLSDTETLVKPEIVTYSTDTPDEKNPGKDYDWHGTPNDPKFIQLPTIQAEGFIQKVGVDQHDEVAVPNNIHMAGWFKDSMVPGETGLSIIDGHIDGRTMSGIFQHLIKLKPGDEYTIEMGNGNLKHYKVRKVITVDVSKAADALFSQDPRVKSQLNLITCGGSFDKKTRKYSQRIIVNSELVKS